MEKKRKGRMIGALCIGLSFCYRFLQIDLCFDYGGAWNYEKNRCERERHELPGWLSHRVVIRQVYVAHVTPDNFGRLSLLQSRFEIHR